LTVTFRKDLRRKLSLKPPQGSAATDLSGGVSFIQASSTDPFWT